MGSWPLRRPKTTVSILRKTYQLLSYNAHQKHTHASSHTKCSFGQRFSSLFHASFHSRSVFQSFDEKPHREQTFETTRFYRVRDFIKLCAVKPTILNTEIAHCLALKVGVIAYLPTSTSLLTAYSRAGNLGSSVAIFTEILHKDVVIWNAMMTAFVDNCCLGAALDLFVEMMRVGSGFDCASLIIAVLASSWMNELAQGRVLHGLSLKTGMLWNSFLCNVLIDMYAKCGDLSASACAFLETSCKDQISWNSIISGCLHNDQFEKSLRYFREMASCSIQADNVSLSCAIAACTSLRNLETGQAIHGWSIKLGYDYECSAGGSVANSLISLYSQCGNIDAADIVFKSMEFKDVVSWNAMVNGFASNGMSSKAFDLLCDMLLGGQPDTVTLVTITTLCAELMLLREGKSIHAFAFQRGLEVDLTLSNSLLDLYLKCNDVMAAEHLFQAMPIRDLISWNTMISGYSQNGYSQEAQSLFKNLLCWPSHVSLSTLLAILPSCDSSKFLLFGKSVHCWQTKLGFSEDILANSSLMSMYINCSEIVASFSLLGEIADFSDTACWNTLIAGCTHNGHFLKALEAFRLMRQKSNVSHDSITLVNVISACGNLELVCEGKSTHGLTLKTSAGANTQVKNALITMYGRFEEIESALLVFNACLTRNLCTWNCMISALSQNKDAKKALELFCWLNIEPNEITISTILSACTRLGFIRHGKQIHGFALRFGFEQNSFVSAALVDMYSNCGRLNTTLKIFQNSAEKSLAAWNALISAYGFHSDGQKAIETYHEMVKSGTYPSKSTFINLLSACSHSGLIKEGLKFYNCMLDTFKLQPVTEHHVCVVDMLGRSGSLQEAYNFIMQMPTKPASGVWGALLSACNYHGDLEMGREVAEILFNLEPGNVSYYISLFNMYVAAGRWNEAMELRNIAQEKRLVKPAGYSFIDVGPG